MAHKKVSSVAPVLPCSPSAASAAPPAVEAPRDRAWARAVPWILAVGLAIRLVTLACAARAPLVGDARSYHETALELLRGNPYEPEWPPGVPLYLAMFYRVLGPSELCGRVSMLPVHLALCWLTYHVAKRLGGPRAAVIALALFNVMPSFVWTSVTPLSQMPSATLALACAVLVERARTGSRVSALLTGLCLAALALTRPSNLALLALVPLYLAYRAERGRRAMSVLLVSLSLSACMGAWTAKAYRMTGRFVLVNSAGAQNVFYGNSPWTPLYKTWWFGSHKERGEELVPDAFLDHFAALNALPIAERDRRYMREALGHIRARPDLFVVRTWARVRTYFAFDTFVGAQLTRRSPDLARATLALDAGGYLLMAMLAIGIPAAAVRDPERRETLAILLLLALGCAIPCFAVFSHPTFHFTVLPLVGLVGATTGAALLDRGMRRSLAELSTRARWGVGVGLVALLAVQIEFIAVGLTRVSHLTAG
jgi:4-amino-4-deoxy-L-arabinose transferase-like glycosyltransferase